MDTVPELRDRLCIIALLQSEKLGILNLAKILIEFAGLSGTGKSSLIRELRISYGYPPESENMFRILSIGNWITFGLYYILKADQRFKVYALHALKRSFLAHQTSTHRYLLEEGVFSYFSHVSRLAARNAGGFMKALKRAGLPNGLILLSCDPITRVSRIQNRSQGCMDLELDDQANVEKSAKWQVVWEQVLGPISEAGVGVLQIDTSKTTVKEAAGTINTWIIELESRLKSL